MSHNSLTVPFLLFTALLLQMCAPSVPADADSVVQQPDIDPDYTDLTIPVNIAPLNFCINEKGDDYITHFYNNNGGEMVVRGKVLDTATDQWHDLLAGARGDTVYCRVYVKNSGRWTSFAPIRYAVAEEIDPYVTYRHIEPLYVNYEVLRICQRCIENFEVTELYNNCGFLDVEGDRQCINCHSVQNYNKEGNMQMHVRVINPGTLIFTGGKSRKVNLKLFDGVGPGAYCSWHPTLPFIAYSVNDTWQHFHSVDPNKVEVQDGASDLILYDLERDEVTRLTDTSTQLETFPYWSPDGRYLYYVSASVPDMAPEDMADYRRNHYKDIKYDIYRMAFDAGTRTFGAPDTVFLASAVNRSATFPRETPDHRFLVFTIGEYGTFHNFHHDADLCVMDLDSGEVRLLDEANSADTESYHCFSSNGRWLLFSSRRDNGSYTRLYLTHFDADGRASKPFILPQKSPFADDLLFKSYNVPEFLASPVTISRKEMIEAVEQPATTPSVRLHQPLSGAAPTQKAE